MCIQFCKFVNFGDCSIFIGDGILRERRERERVLSFFEIRLKWLNLNISYFY